MLVVPTTTNDTEKYPVQLTKYRGKVLMSQPRPKRLQKLPLQSKKIKKTASKFFPNGSCGLQSPSSPSKRQKYILKFKDLPSIQVTVKSSVTGRLPFDSVEYRIPWQGFAAVLDLIQNQAE